MTKKKVIEAREKLWQVAFNAINNLFNVYNSTATELFDYDFIKLRQFECVAKSLEVIREYND